MHEAVCFAVITQAALARAFEADTRLLGGSNPCMLRFADVRDITKVWAFGRDSIGCVKEIAGIREPVSPIHAGPPVVFECPEPSYYARFGHGNEQLCFKWRQRKFYTLERDILNLAENPEHTVPGLTSSSVGDPTMLEFESRDARRVYTIAMHRNREDLLYGGLTRMKFEVNSMSCLTPRCTQDFIAAYTFPYTDITFGRGSWQLRQSWSELRTQSLTYKAFVEALHRDKLLDSTHQPLHRTRKRAISPEFISAFKKRIETIPLQGTRHTFQYDTIINSGYEYVTHTLAFNRSDYLLLYEWVHPAGARMLYVVRPDDGIFHSSLFIQPPVNHTAITAKLYH